MVKVPEWNCGVARNVWRVWSIARRAGEAAPTPRPWSSARTNVGYPNALGNAPFKDYRVTVASPDDFLLDVSPSSSLSIHRVCDHRWIDRVARVRRGRSKGRASLERHRAGGAVAF